MEILSKYFPGLSAMQIEKFTRFEILFREWNEKINLVSRKDMDNFRERHLLHSLGIAKVMEFAPGTRVMDVGTGGGLPGIPLAIMFPGARFLLIDSIGKKIRAVQDMIHGLDLENTRAKHGRAEDVKETFDFITARAVTALPDFHKMVKKKVKVQGRNSLPNGILYLKGGDLGTEISGMKKKVKLFPLKDYFEEEFFETKQVVLVEV